MGAGGGHIYEAHSWCVPGTAMNWIYVGVIGASLLLVLSVEEKYKRPQNALAAVAAVEEEGAGVSASATASRDATFATAAFPRAEIAPATPAAVLEDA